MAQHALVNNIDHKDIKIINKRSAELGDDLWYALTFPREFRSVQTHYPILSAQRPANRPILIRCAIWFPRRRKFISR